jgi:hypothetical protein
VRSGVMTRHRTLRSVLAAGAFALLVAATAWTPGPASALTTSASTPAANWTLGGEPCRLIGVPAAAPVGTGTCPGVRPGAIVNSDTGQCTFNFLFTGSDGNRYIGTAGHCILGDSPVGGDVGEQSWAPGTGPEARDGNDVRIGEFAYAILQDPKDFALIRLDPGVQANPQMCHFGGPTGLNDDITEELTVLQHFGNGLGVGAVLPARSALAFGLPDPDHVYAEGAVVPGDSGSGIISDDGRAVGVIVTTGVHTNSIGFPVIDAGTMGVTRLGPQVARAGQVLGLALTLQTAPQL